MQLAKIPANLIVVDEPLPFDVFDAHRKLLLSKGHLVGSDTQRDTLLARGLFADAEAIKKAVANQRGPRERATDPFALWDQVYQRLNLLLRSEDLDPATFPGKLLEVVNIVNVLATKYGDAAICALLHSDMTKYSVMHCFHCGLVCALLANRLNCSAEQREALIGAALTMNVSMIELQTNLLKHTGPLTGEQRSQVRSHPVGSRHWLERAGITQSLWLQIVEQHHEEVNGSGYPAGIKTPCDLALLLNLVDTFCAKISPRQYRKPMLVNAAAKVLFENAHSPVEATYAASLIKEMGIYPPGTLLKLESGETAIAIKRGTQASTPLVMALCNPEGIGYASPLQRDTGKKGLAVKSVISPDAMLLRFDVRRLYGFGA